MIKKNNFYEYTGSKSGELIQEIAEENKFLLKLVDTIPAKFYFDHGIQEKLASEKHMAMDKKAEGIVSNSFKQVLLLCALLPLHMISF